MNKEMQQALIADGEKLKAMTSEDHGPFFECPECGADLAIESCDCERVYNEP